MHSQEQTAHYLCRVLNSAVANPASGMPEKHECKQNFHEQVSDSEVANAMTPCVEETMRLLNADSAAKTLEHEHSCAASIQEAIQCKRIRTSLLDETLSCELGLCRLISGDSFRLECLCSQTD